MSPPPTYPHDAHYLPHPDAYNPDDLSNAVQHMTIHEDGYASQYSFQPFIPYPTPPTQYMPQQSYQYGYNGSPYQDHNRAFFTPTRHSPQIPSSPYPPPPGAMWNSPPMSPAIGVIDARRASAMDDYNRQSFYPHWNNASGSYRPPRGPMPGPPRTANRMSWSGPSKDKLAERKAYHPQPPANRSDWVMWVGNVPANTSHEELWRFFNSPINSEPWAGPSSIFLISRSSCAFVNLTSEEDLKRAVAWFNGKSLRPFDTRCPRLVCRVRRKDDDLRSGVGAQRGTGMHRDWIKKQQAGAGESAPAAPETPTSPAVVEPPPPGEARRRESVVDDTTHRSTESYASTNSSFLTRHFPLRAFILKSATVEELEESVRTGQWRTQKHNEPVLDQALRTSQDVVLIFGANKSGEFFGYAKMVEHIDKEKAKKWSGSKSSAKPKTSMIEEETENRTRGGSEPIRPSYFLTPSQSHLAASSPSELTPAEEFDFSPDHRANTDPTKLRPDRPASPRAMTLDPKQVQPNYFPPVPIPAHSAESQADVQRVLGGSSRPAQGGDDGVLRKDTALSPSEKPDVADDAGVPFKIDWVKVGRLPFNNTRHLRNPWNADREVKVSRDGTEVEPGVAMQLMALWP